MSFSTKNETIDHDRSYNFPLPDLSGKQCVENGYVQEGDIMVGKSSCSYVYRGDRAIGRNIGALDDMGYRIYRAIPVPSQGLQDSPLRQAIEIMKDDVRKELRKMDYKEKPKSKTSDNGKPPLARLPLKAIRELAMVQRYGKIKYNDDWNWKLGMEVSRHCSCALRHIYDFMDGQTLDKESGRHALAHAAIRLLYVIENMEEGTHIDDRYSHADHNERGLEGGPGGGKIQNGWPKEKDL